MFNTRILWYCVIVYSHFMGDVPNIYKKKQPKSYTSRCVFTHQDLHTKYINKLFARWFLHCSINYLSDLISSFLSLGFCSNVLQ